MVVLFFILYRARISSMDGAALCLGWPVVFSHRRAVRGARASTREHEEHVQEDTEYRIDDGSDMARSAMDSSGGCLASSPSCGAEPSPTRRFPSAASG